MPRIEVLYIAGCPNWRDALRLAHDAAQEAGAAGAEVLATEVRGERQAARLGFAGSPTFLVAGKNPFPGAPAGAQACRLFRTPSGPAGLPERAELVEAVRAALSPGRPGPRA